jgi:hypothetical protein
LDTIFIIVKNHKIASTTALSLRKNEHQFEMLEIKEVV